MNARLPVSVTITLKRQSVDQLWLGQRWHATSVALDRGSDVPSARTDGNRPAIYASPRSSVAAWAPASIELAAQLMLDRAEVPAYLINLVNGSPALFIAIQETDTVVALNGITASPLAVDTFDRPGIVTVDRVPMPREIIDVIRAFVDQLTPAPGARARALRPTL